MRKMVKHTLKKTVKILTTLEFELSISQQHHLADLLKDTSNYVLVSMVISQFLEVNSRLPIVVLGCILFLVLLIFSTWLAKKESDD